MKYHSVLLIIGILAGTLLPVATAQDLTANLTDGCVEDYDPSVDYFPEKAEITHAQGLRIEYFNNYKVVTVSNPWRGANVSFQYVLVQCGTPAPEDFEDAVLIDVPTKTVISMSTTQIPHLDQMGLLGGLVGLDQLQFVSNPQVRAMIDEGKVVEVGYGATVNVELVLELDPDLVMTFSSGNPEFDSHPLLLDAGIPTVLIGDWTETTPLGRSEWIKFTAVFFNQEAAAERIYDGIVEQYQALAALVADVPERPTVFTDSPFEGVWYMPGGRSYMAALLKDAGAEYLWANDDTVGSIPLDFESVLEHAIDADFWLNVGYWNSLADGLAQDERFAKFAAFQNGQVYNNNLRVNAGGGNDFYETGASNPELVLADLIAIFHPEVLPDHEFYFYQKLE